MIDSQNWPTEEPVIEDIVGTWLVSDDSINFAKEKFDLDYEGSKLVLNPNNTFEFHNFLDCDFDVNCKVIEKLKGNWSIQKWGIHFEVQLLPQQNKYSNIQVFIWNTQAPYRLWVALSDLDNGNYIFYDRQ
jgi:hypothetical protein